MVNYLFSGREDIIRNSNFSLLKKDQLGWNIEKNAVILPTLDKNQNSGGVCDTTMTFLNSSKMDVGWLKRGGNYKIDEDKIAYSKSKVIYLGFFVKHWGHFLVDCMDRAWILNRPEFKEYKVCFLEENGKNISGNYKKVLKYLGVSDERLIIVKAPTRFLEVVIPETCRIDSLTYYSEYIEIFKTIVSNININIYNVDEKIYLSRSHLKNSQEIGEKNIEDAFRSNDFTVKYPEELSFEEQVAIFQKAKVLVGINGSIPLNSLFASEKVKIVILNKMSLRHQNMLNVSSLMNITPQYIDVYYEPIKGHPKSLGVGPFWVEVNQNLNAYFRENGYTEQPVMKKRRLADYLYYCYLYLRNSFIGRAVRIKHVILR